MFERSKNLPFMLEAPEDGIRIHPALNQLDRNLHLELLICALRKVDRAHAPGADAIEQFVLTDRTSSLWRIGRTAERVRYQSRRWIRDKIIGRLIGFEQPFDFTSELRIVAAGIVEKGVALVRRKLARGVKDFFKSIQRRRAHRFFSAPSVPYGAKPWRIPNPGES
jgi:hypothetical protein